MSDAVDADESRERGDAGSERGDAGSERGDAGSERGDAGSERGGRVPAEVGSHDAFGGPGSPTGWRVSEPAQPYLAPTRAGYGVDVASPAGGAAPVDARSDPDDEAAQTPEGVVGTGVLENAATRRAGTGTTAHADVDASGYDGVSLGGYGASYDFPGNEPLVRVAREVRGPCGVGGAVRHGAAALPSLVDDAGRPLVAGRTVTGRSRAEDEAVGERSGAILLDSCVEDARGAARAGGVS
jgi:putative intracellular protease/amidase